MGNQCGCADKNDTEQEVRADPVSYYPKAFSDCEKLTMTASIMFAKGTEVSNVCFGLSQLLSNRDVFVCHVSLGA